MTLPETKKNNEDINKFLKVYNRINKKQREKQYLFYFTSLIIVGNCPIRT